jgi:alpha-ketoglutarate-dependent 2,4-dichlorophenoxyacetate dioxygenase
MFSKHVSRFVLSSSCGAILDKLSKYGVCVFRNTGLDDKGHVEFSRQFGELDDIRPYLHPSRKLRYEYLELFDAGNVGDDGVLLTADNPRWHYNIVCTDLF